MATGRVRLQRQTLSNHSGDAARRHDLAHAGKFDLGWIGSRASEQIQGNEIDGTRKHQVNFVRYADDFIITGKSKELLENEVKPLVENFLKERGLTLSVEKTKATHIEEGFDFLGWNFRKYDGKLLIKPSKKT